MEYQSNGPTSSDNRLHFLDYWRILRLRKGVIFVNFIFVVLVATFVTYLLPKTYKSTVRMDVKKDTASDIELLGGTPQGPDFDPFFILTQFERLQSAEVLYPVIEKMNLGRVWGARYGIGEFTPQKTKLLLEKRIDPTQVRNTSIIALTVYSEDKKEAAEIANTIAKVYAETREQNRITQVRKGIAKMREKLGEASNSVVQAQADVQRVREELKFDVIMETPGKVALALDSERVRALEMLNIEMNAGLTSKKTQLEQLKSLSPKVLGNALMTVLPNEINLPRLYEQLATAQQELVAKGKELGPKNPEIERMTKVILEIQLQIEGRVKGIMSGLEAEAKALQSGYDNRMTQLDKAREQNRTAAENGQRYMDVQKKLERLERIRDTIELKIESEEIDADIGRTAAVEVIDPAEPAIRPAKPKVALNIALGVVLGAVMGIGMAFFIEYLDTSVKTIDDVEHTLQAPVLAVIPQNVGVLMNEDPDTPHAEPYRVLRTNILFTNKKPNANTITVVSGGAGEGKSTTVLNLATIFAQNGNRVLLVDSDLRRPSLHKRLDIENSPGLTDYLLGQGKLEDVIQKTDQADLDLLPSGKLPSSAMGILNSQQMRDFVKEVQSRYDFILLDSPPLMGVSDATVLTSMVDLTLLVIQYRKYPQSLAVRSRQMIEKVGGTLLGIVLNNINVSSDASYYYYSGYHYHDNPSSSGSLNIDSKPRELKGKVDRQRGQDSSEEPDLKSKY
ncbi:MAG: capsular biosynthesis protein [Verrucomicrobiales bacterium]|nr:capsular biosynthesis protein [Verrucomicrobiales bacterium]|tara:strand:- start:15904 stop:18102 length:2199 start_codon:yes stop_codon:yes gene_type:complete